MFVLTFSTFYNISIYPIHAETLIISHTDIPTTIRVGLTGFVDGGIWRRKGAVIKDVIDVPFQEYVKNVVAHEWRFPKDTANTPGAITIQKVGAMAVKTMSWWKINLPPGKALSRHQLSDHPDIVDNTDDHVYIEPSCQGENTPLCKQLSSHREIGGFADQAVDETWTTLLKRKDCFRHNDECSDVFAVQYRTTLAGCKKDNVVSFCIPQKEARAEADTFKLTKGSLAKLPKELANTLADLQDQRFTTQEAFFDAISAKIGADALAAHQDAIMASAVTPLTWEAILNKYYDYETSDKTLLPALYAQQPLQVRHTAEALSRCIEARKDDDWALHGCRIVKKKRAWYACPRDQHTAEDKDNETSLCPSSPSLIAVDTHGVILDVKEKTVTKTVKTTTWYVTETWLKVKWRVKPGFELDTGILTPGNDLVGWVQDKDLRPVGDGVSPLVQVRITGATVKP